MKHPRTDAKVCHEQLRGGDGMGNHMCEGGFLVGIGI